MTTIKNSIRKIVPGLFIAMLALGFSAFTKSNNSTFIADRVWINDGAKYVRMDLADPESNCLSIETEQCALVSTDVLENIPSIIEYEDVEDFVSLEAHPKSFEGIYDVE